MGHAIRRGAEVVLWLAGAALAGLGCLVLWNLRNDDAHDTPAAWFLFGAAAFGVPGILLLQSAWRMHRRSGRGVPSG